MKKLLLSVLAGLTVSSVLSCDVCGCSVSGFTPGLASFQNRHLVGISYLSRSFQSEHPILFEGETPVISNESFNTLAITGRYSPHRFLQFSGVLPMHHFAKNEEGKITTNTGIGDVQFTAYFVLATSAKDTSNFATRFTIGGGMKAPTGAYQSAGESGKVIVPALQMGSGSWDAIYNATFLQRAYRWGFYAEGFYRWNQENKSGYRFGNRTAIITKLMRWISVGKNDQFLIIPELGLNFEASEKDFDNYFKKEKNPYTGGYFLDGAFGVNLFYQNFNLGCALRTPIKQQFAQGLVTASTGVNIQFNYLFNSK